MAVWLPKWIASSQRSVVESFPVVRYTWDKRRPLFAFSKYPADVAGPKLLEIKNKYLSH